MIIIFIYSNIIILGCTDNAESSGYSSYIPTPKYTPSPPRTNQEQGLADQRQNNKRTESSTEYVKP